MQINVNGQNYDSWASVPPEVRQQLLAVLPDADRNGVPDLFETGALPAGAATYASSVTVNGSTVNSLAELPPEVREQLHQVFGWAMPMFGAAPGAATPPPQTGQPPAAAQPRLEPGQVMLNGVPTSVSDATAEKKSWWRRLIGG